MRDRNDEVERSEKLADFMLDYLLDLQRRERVNISQNDFAVRLGISTNVMSRIMRKAGLPSLENTIQLSKTVGPEVFDIVGYPRLAYTDRAFQIIMDEWPHLTEEERSALVRNIKELSGNERAHASTQTIPA